MPDPRNPHNSYYYKPMDQAAPIYIPPSKSTQRILPVPQKEGQTAYHYGMPGQAAPVYIPPSKSAGKRMAKNNYVKSDERSKDEIRRLESTNEALTKALDQSQAMTGGDQTQYPTMPANTRLPVGRANFADTPAANTVAAQNVGLLQAQQQQASVPQAAPPMRPQAPGFNVGQPMPDLSALDEAYRNIGRQQGGG